VLLEKSLNGMTLTEAGYKILPLAEMMLENHTKYESLIIASVSHNKNTVKISLEHEYFTAFIPLDLTMQMNVINVKFDIVRSKQRCVSAVSDGKADLAIIEGNDENKGLEFIPFDSSQLMVIMAKNHYLAKKPGLTIADMRDVAQIWPSSLKAKGISLYISACIEEGFYPNIIYQNLGFDLLIKNILTQNLVMVSPQCIVKEFLPKDIVTHPLIHGGIRADLGFILHPRNKDNLLVNSYIKAMVSYHAQ
jgi:DNA-binding transcriptional LysR family regulator